MTVGSVTLIVLGIAALLTSALSAIIGMGGGMLLLAVLFSFLSHGEAIPTHAAVQIASNGTRVLAYLRNVHWRTVGRFCVGALPGSALGFVLLSSLGRLEDRDPYLKTAVGVYILIATFVPKPKRAAMVAKWWDFPLIGLVAGTAALTVGAIGPLIAPLFARRDFVKEKLIATKAVCQLTLHILKIPAFYVLGTFDLPSLGVLTAVMVAAVIPGTLLGRRVLKHVSDRHFVTLYRVALTVSGAKILIFDGLLKVVSG